MCVWYIYVGLGIFPWGCIKRKISYSPWWKASSGDRHQGCEVQLQEKHLKEITCLELATLLEIKASEDELNRASPIVAYGGEIYESSPSGA